MSSNVLEDLLLGSFGDTSSSGSATLVPYSPKIQKRVAHNKPKKNWAPPVTAVKRSTEPEKKKKEKKRAERSLKIICS